MCLRAVFLRANRAGEASSRVVHVLYCPRLSSSLPLCLYWSDVTLKSRRLGDRAEALQHRGSTFIKRGFQELSTIASQEKKEGKSQKRETPQNMVVWLYFLPRWKYVFSYFSLFFLPASQTEDSFTSWWTSCLSPFFEYQSSLLSWQNWPSLWIQATCMPCSWIAHNSAAWKEHRREGCSNLTFVALCH